MQVKFVGPNCTLGEGPLWHPLLNKLFWFDILKFNLHSCDADGDNYNFVSFSEPASAAGWLDEDNLIIAVASGLLKYEISSGVSAKIYNFEKSSTKTRTNDGRVGPNDSFWFGTMGLEGENEAGSLYCYNSNGLKTIEQNITIPNSICFSPDKKTAYFSDTRKKIIWAHTLNSQGLPIGKKRVFLDLNKDGLKPDGSVCDSEGFLWNAQWGASRIARYAPDGSLSRVIELPVSRPTCPSFGGADYKTLFITSAQQGMTEQELSLEPEAGKLLILQVDVAGIPELQALKIT